MHKYKISITGEYDMIVLTPKMISLLIEKVQCFDMQKLIIPAEEILPQGYTEYLIRVLQANRSIEPPNICIRKVYELTADQIKKLCIDYQKCFDEVILYEHLHRTQFHLSASKPFCMLVRQSLSSITYVYTDEL